MDQFLSIRVLVAEDHPDNCVYLERVLRHYGADVRSAQTATAALEMFHDFDPDMIIIDLGLPDINGWQLRREIAQLAELRMRPVWQIAVTGFHSAKVGREAIAEGFHAYFSKPIDMAVFVSGVRRVVNR